MAVEQYKHKFKNSIDNIVVKQLMASLSDAMICLELNTADAAA